jgi:hypothetical protein
MLYKNEVNAAQKRATENYDNDPSDFNKGVLDALNYVMEISELDPTLNDRDPDNELDLTED